MRRHDLPTFSIIDSTLPYGHRFKGFSLLFIQTHPHTTRSLVILAISWTFCSPHYFVEAFVRCRIQSGTLQMKIRLMSEQMTISRKSECQSRSRSDTVSRRIVRRNIEDLEGSMQEISLDAFENPPLLCYSIWLAKITDRS